MNKEQKLKQARELRLRLREVGLEKLLNDIVLVPFTPIHPFKQEYILEIYEGVRLLIPITAPEN